MSTPPECCYVCRWALGPATMPALLCTCPRSEFNKQPVAAEGYCPEFDPATDDPEETV
jgi:hypothetical protein